MAGGHASSRVGKPGISIRRPAVPPSPARPTPSGSVVASTPSKQTRTTAQETPNHDYLAESSDTEAAPSRGTIPLIMPRNAASSSISIAPGISRIQSRPFNPPRTTEPQSSASASEISRPSNAPIATTIPVANETDKDIASTSLHLTTALVPERASNAQSLSSGRLHIAEDNSSLLTPPPTQLPIPPRISENGNAALVQPGPSRITNSDGMRMPLTQASTIDFPVDPSILEFTNLTQEDELQAPSAMAQIIVEPPQGFSSALTTGIGQLLPPPLPVEPEPPASEESGVNVVGSTTSGKSKRGRQTSAKEPQTRKRRRTAKSQEEFAEGQEDTVEADQSESKPRRRRSSQKKGRKPVTMEEKIEALEQEATRAAQAEDTDPLDPTTATMASLCDSDIPNGRLSSKYLEKGIAYVKHVEERRQRIMERTAERLKKLRQSGLDADQPQPAIKKPEPTPVPVPPGAEVDEDENPVAGRSGPRELGASLSPSPEREPGPPQETFVESAAAPQIRFVNGEMILDEDSQFYDRAGGTVQDEDSMVVVDEADSTRFSNSNSFMKKVGSRGSRWTADETELFYWCLSAFGEDYENIARYLGRTPLQCKNKTKSEDRRGNEKRITLAIKTRIPLDLEEFGRITGRDFSGPPPEIRAPVVPRAENEEQEPVPSSVKARALSTTPRKNRKASSSHAEEEIMTLEEYERDGKDD
ncbi:unnamed protein product [Rhizoctonia solani]|uniref:SANT domain-containing protein n=1 Tax=Rhizoctonia solani TaxID=456999 RepID=A0A8H2WAI7_9AGAM|nr:unnamed protein product [Rhizoctonia solani]